MILTSKEARTLLEIERKNTTDDRWIEHCISVLEELLKHYVKKK